jgi:hypothetical protein
MAVLLALHTRQGAKKNHVLSRLLIYFLNREENLPHFLEVPPSINNHKQKRQ